MEPIEMDLSNKIVFNFARKLACNDQPSRTRSLKQLKLFLQNLSKSEGSELMLLRLWKGLHYCMWMADKPLFQEHLAGQLSRLMHTIKSDQGLPLCFFAAFLLIEAKEWPLIDNLRIDKFMMLVRFMTREAMSLMQQGGWTEASTKLFTGALQRLFKEGRGSKGLLVHLLDILLPELEKITNGKEVPGGFVKALACLFIRVLSSCPDQYLAKDIKKKVLYRLNEPHFKVDKKWYEEQLLQAASKDGCQHRPLLTTLLKQMDAMEEKGVIKKKRNRVTKKDVKRMTGKEWEGLEEKEAVERLKQFEMEGMMTKKMKREEIRKMKKKVVIVKKERDDDDDDEEEEEEEEEGEEEDEEDFGEEIDDDSCEEDEAENSEEVEEEKGREGGNRKKVLNGAYFEGEDDEEDDEEDEDGEDDDDGDMMGFLDFEADEDDEEDDAGIDEDSENAEMEEEEYEEIGKKRKRKKKEKALKTPQKHIRLEEENAKSSDKKSVVFNQKCLAKKFHKNSKVTPKFDPASKPLRSALKASPLPAKLKLTPSPKAKHTSPKLSNGKIRHSSRKKAATNPKIKQPATNKRLRASLS